MFVRSFVKIQRKRLCRSLATTFEPEFNKIFKINRSDIFTFIKIVMDRVFALFINFSATFFGGKRVENEDRCLLKVRSGKSGLF
jgi:hypothetical protein